LTEVSDGFIVVEACQRLDPPASRTYTPGVGERMKGMQGGMNKDTRTESIDVIYVAHLARMHISDEEAKTFQGQLEHVLDHVRTLRALNVDDVEPTAHAVPVHNVFREDSVTPCLDHADVMNNAPSPRNGLFMVPKILE